jgi:type IX secretion system PorP/SprF family membrane protein
MGESQLSFGLSLAFFQLKIQDDQFVLSDNTADDLILGSKQSIWITDANFGVYYLTRTFSAGYSTVQLFNSSAQFGERGKGEYKLCRQHNFIGSYRIELTTSLNLEPSFLLKIPEEGVSQLDLSVKCKYKAKYWAGLNYRTRSTLSIFGGLKYDRYSFGYAFDYNINDLMPNTYGSHEFLVSARFGDSARRYKWLNTY